MVGFGEKHASVRLYWIFALILCAVTFIEWIIFKSESLRAQAWFMIPALTGLSLCKFAMVCGWYMHLRYDHKILAKVFGFSVLLALIIFGILFLAL